MRFPGTKRHPFRAGASLQYVSLSLALREDSGQASIAALIPGQQSLYGFLR